MKRVRTSLSRPAILTTAGITCLQVFDCLEPFLEPVGGHGLQAGYPVVSLLLILCYLAIAATFKCSASILESRRLSSVLCLGASVCAGVVAFCTFDAPLLPTWAPAAALVMVVCFHCALNLNFLASLCRHGISTVILCLAVSNVIASPVAAAISLTGNRAVIIAAVTLLPLCVLGILYTQDRIYGPAGQSPETNQDATAESDLETSRDATAMVRPVVLMVLTIAATSFIRSFTPAVLDSVSFFGALAGSAFVAAAIMGSGRRVRFRSLYQASWILIVTALLLVSLADFAPRLAAGVMGNAGYILFDIFITALIANACRLSSLSPYLAFSITGCGGAAAFCLGGLFGSAFSGATPYTVAITAFFLATILAAASNLLLTDDDYRTSWGTIRPSAEHDSIAIFYGSLPATCDAISQQYGLTPREEEVLILLAQRKSVADIEVELFISNPTAKTHVRNIYRKLGIHKRAELLAMVGHPSTASAASASTDGD